MIERYFHLPNFDDQTLFFNADQMSQVIVFYNRNLMQTTIEGFVKISDGVEVPSSIQNGSNIVRLKNQDNKLVLEDQKGSTKIFWEKHIIKLKALCYQGNFILAGKLPNTKWQILRKQKIDKPVSKWALRMDTQDPLELGYLDPQEILDTLKRGREECSTQETCSMCLETLDCDIEEKVLTQCGHQFHKRCLKPWIFQNSCPNCRKPLFKKKQKLE